MVHVDGKVALIKSWIACNLKKAWIILEKLKNLGIVLSRSRYKIFEDFKTTRKQHFYKDYIQRWLSYWIGYVDETVFDVNMLSIS